MFRSLTNCCLSLTKEGRFLQEIAGRFTSAMLPVAAKHKLTRRQPVEMSACVAKESPGNQDAKNCYFVRSPQLTGKLINSRKRYANLYYLTHITHIFSIPHKIKFSVSDWF
jgi:hypothetical protein